MDPASVGDLLRLSKSLATWSSIAYVVYYIGTLIYNVFFHPLRSYPGPLHWRASRLPFVYHNIRGTMPFDVLPMFEKYGPVVRLAPNELAYVDAAAWKDILGHDPKSEESGKWHLFYRPAKGQPQDLISADRELHSKLRRLLSHGFSDRAMREQEPIILGYVDLMMQRLREQCKGGQESLDMEKWYNFMTFDTIGDLAFGEPFGCLQNSAWHFWVETMFKLLDLGIYMQCAIHFPTLKDLLLNMIPPSIKKIHGEHTAYTRHKIGKRMDLSTTRYDLIGGLLQKQDELQISQGDIESHGLLLVVAGSETTATLLTAVTYLLCTHPKVLARLTHEVRSTFSAEGEIKITSAARLPYLQACLDEALRFYPPVPVGLPRIVPRGGKEFCGQYVPAGTHVGVWQWAAYHYSENFVEPFAYRPERFIDGENERFARDKREALQPFSYGKRDCIGKNLAYAELRTTLARMIFNFDMKLARKSEGWLDGQRVYNLWRKPPLYVHLTPRGESM